MKTYYVTYRGEFSAEVEAESKEVAMAIVEDGNCNWMQDGELHPCFLEISENEEI